MQRGERSPRRWDGGLLALGLLLLALLLALTARSIHREWRQQVGQSRADAMFQLVQERAALRPTDTPGASAWLDLELKRYSRLVRDPAKARLWGEIAEWPDARSVPPPFAPIHRVLATPPDPPGPAAARLLPPESAAGAAELRVQRFLEVDGRWLVVTRRRALDAPALDEASSPSDRFLARAAPHLLRLAADLRRALAERPLPALPGDRPPRVVRLYALAEDGTLVSLPLATAPGPAAERRAALAEGREFRKLPELPTFVSNEFYFRFDFAEPGRQCFYSGLYLDLGGQGVVATIAVPEPGTVAGVRWLVGADLTLDVDWAALARQLEPPMAAEVVRLGGTPDRWRPWSGIRDAAGAAPAPATELRAAVAALAEREPLAAPIGGQPYVLHGVAPGRGAVAAFQVAAETWLLVLFPRTEPRLPLVPVSLSLGVLALLLAGLERNRRRAERAQVRAEGALAEKQNLLNTMQVPLVVVDPNTDEVVSSNRAAEGLGIRPGARVAELVDDDPRARAHYERMQVAGPEPRRAYGVPVTVRNERGLPERRYAIVRSVAVTAPIEALAADERHRLGILFLLEPDADLALWAEDLAGATRGDERRRLAGLLTHGVDTLVRVLAHCLARDSDPGAAPGLAAWLAGYADDRLRTIGWLLDHWDAAPPLTPDCSIAAAQARATLERLASVFALAAADPELRCRLRWDNGVLAARPEGGGPVFTADVDWPETHWLPCPVRGGFGLFLTEVLVNAVRHGRPGSAPSVSIALDRVRREIHFAVENELRPDDLGGSDGGGGTYGGLAILSRMARLFDWQGPACERAAGTFRVTWSAPACERGDPRRAD